MGERRSTAKLDSADELLRSRGLRRTYTRLNILKCLEAQPGPVTHAQMSLLLAPLGLDGSTIFRGLNDLTEAGLVCRLDPGDRVWRFELRDKPASPHEPPQQHPHMFCRKCGRIDCLTGQNGNTIGAKASGWQIEQIVYVGCCPNCQACSATTDCS